LERANALLLFTVTKQWVHDDDASAWLRDEISRRGRAKSLHSFVSRFQRFLPYQVLHRVFEGIATLFLFATLDGK